MMKKCQNFINTAWKLSLFGVIQVHIFPHLDWMREIADQKSSEYEHFLRSYKSKDFFPEKRNWKK